MRRLPHRGAPAAALVMVAMVATLAIIASCRGADRERDGTATSSGAARPERYGLGQPATPARLAALDIDANASGAGLPAGRGTHADGAVTYAQKCASCHGVKGEGIAPNPQLVGAEPRDGFPFGRDVTLPKTVGNYWPYATTLYDYIHRAMPLTAPESLKPDEVYSLVAFLLAENGIVPKTAVIDAASLPKVQMPAQKHFVPDDRKGGAVFR